MKTVTPVFPHAVPTALCAVAVLTLIAAVAPAQTRGPLREFERYLPKSVPNELGEARLPDAPADAQGNDRVLVDRLRAIVVLDHPDQVVVGPIEANGVEIRGEQLHLPNTPEFHELVAGYMDGPVSVLRLNEMAREIILFYRDNDLPVVDVSIPQQDITNGVVQIVIIEGRLGKVCVEGSRYFDPAMLHRQVRLWPGGLLHESVLQEELRWLNRNPFRSVDLTLRPGEEFGETDVVFNVDDRRPWRAYVGYEDTGTRSVGLERTIYGINMGNVLGRDHELAYQFTAAADFQMLTAHSLVYAVPTRSRDRLLFFGSYADIDTTFDNNDLIGHAWQTSIRYLRDLAPVCCYTHAAVVGFDYRRATTFVDFGTEDLTFPATDVIQLMVGYHGRRLDDCGASGVGAELFISPGNLSPTNSDARFQISRAMASSDYVYTRLYFEREQNLPRNLLFYGRVSGQVADANLLPSEQMGFGGIYSVRGYDMRLVNGDSGYLVNLEIRTCPINPGWARCEVDQLSFLVFGDIGAAYNHSRLQNEPRSVELASAGVGMRYIAGPRFSLLVDYGWPLEPVPGLTDRDGRFHIGTVISY
jgi:hemolysin activation/secretion protein